MGSQFLSKILDLIIGIYIVRLQYKNFNIMTFKQQYLHKNSPFTIDFPQQRRSVLQKITQLIRSFHPNEWNIRAFNPLSYLESYKQVYGMTSQQLTEITVELLGIIEGRDRELSCQAVIAIMKVLIRLREYRITLAPHVNFNNTFYIEKLKYFIRYGVPFPLKNADSYIQNFIKLIRIYCKYGQQKFQDVLNLAIQQRDIKYIAIFIKSVKTQQTAQTILNHIFQQSSVFDRDTSFFYIIAQLTYQFPKLSLQKYHNSLHQQIIKSITTIVNPAAEQDLKKITNEDSTLDINCILKSIGRILINGLKPVGEPGWQRGWAGVQRIFSIIGGVIDHSHEVESVNDFLIFMKDFVKIFLARYRKEQGLYKEVNEDYVEQFRGQPLQYQVIGKQYIKLFNQLWLPLIPQLLYLQDGQVRTPKILSDLVMFQPEIYLSYLLQQIKLYLQKDLTINSIYTPKMTILFLQQFIISNYYQQHEFTLLIQCMEGLLNALEKLGITENLDILELVMRCYMYFPEAAIEDVGTVRGLTDDIIEIIEANMDSMSINLEGTDTEEAELYTDFKNIYLNFIIRLNQTQINGICDKMLYKIGTSVPQHRQAYQYIITCLGFMNKQFAKKILDIAWKNIVTHKRKPQQLQTKDSQNSLPKSSAFKLLQEIFPMHSDYALSTKNQQHVRFYSSVLQCAFQYHPQNIVAHWQKLQTIIVLMLREVQTASICDWGLDLLFNLILNLQQIHLEPREFFKNQNRNYKTMKNVNWKHPTNQMIGILQQIKKNFYDSISTVMRNRYEIIIQNSQKAQRLRSQRVIQIIFDKSDTSIGPRPIEVRQFVNQFLDCLLVPSTPTLQDIQQKKHLNKMISIQYTVFSALQLRAQYTSHTDMYQIEPLFIKQLGCLRKHAIQHLKWTIQILGHFNCLYDPTILKLFHYFWRQAHDQLYFTAGIQATNEKLHPYFYPTLYKNKQIFQNSFLIMTQCFVTFMMRIQLFTMLKPIAHLNNPQFLQYLVPLTFSSALDCSIKSFIPSSTDPHLSYHFEIMNICRLKLSLYNANSYIRKSIVYSKAGNQGINKIEKEKYIGAIRVIISNYKRNMSIFMYPCCMRDECFWYGVQETLEVSQYLEKKNDKVGIVQIIYIIIVFSFDFKGWHVYKVDMRQVDKNQAILDKEDTQMKVKIINFVRFLMQKTSTQIIKKFFQKDATVLVLVLLCFSQFIPIDEEIYRQIIPLVVQITLKNSQDMMNMGKSFLFRILNRYIKKKTQIVYEQNTPIKRSYENFIAFRHLGGRLIQGTEQPLPNLITNKSDNYYFPLPQLQYLYRMPLDPHKANQQVLLSKIADQSILRLIFKSLLSDTELKTQQTQVDVSYVSEQEPKRLYSNGHKIINYILDSNPKKLSIYLSFIDNFSNYPICFYHRLFRKMMILGGAQTIKNLQIIAKQEIKSQQKQQVKLAQFLIAQILPFCPNDEQFFEFYTNFLVSCSKEQFQFANSCLLVVFCIDWKVSKIIFNKIIERLRKQKGPSRLRHLEVFNHYLLCSGRFAQEQAKNGIKYLMKGIQEGTDEVSQLIVSMLIYCFIIPINLNLIQKWLKQQQYQIVKKTKIYQLDFNTGYQINELVRMIIMQIVNKTKQQKNMQSKNLKIYSKIAYKVLSNITVYRFNDQFYNLFKDTMFYIVNKPLQQGNFDQEIVTQLKDSQYPQNIYNDLIKELTNMQGNTLNVQKKKLKFIESAVINKIYSSNQVNIPDIFATISQKSTTIDHIIAVSNMARIMKPQQLTDQVQKTLSIEKKTVKNLYFMMAYLLAAGTRDFDWKQKLLNQILGFKKQKIVKEFVSYWWKGRSPETEKEQRLCMLVRNVQNPYSYFA